MSQDRSIFLFIGPPGSGKGSLSKYCLQELGWKQLSTGDLLRKHVFEQTELGKQIDFILKSGKLLSDELINSIVEQWLTEVFQDTDTQGIIFDGYPRTVGQAEALDSFLQEKFPEIQLRVARLNVSDQVAIDRMCARYVCQNKECQAVYSMLKDSSMRPGDDMTCTKCRHTVGKRSDDTENVVQDRLQIYRKSEDDLIAFYKQQGREVTECDAEQSLGDLFKDFKKLISTN